MAYVITNWSVSHHPDAQGRYVQINGRKGGLVSFVLSTMGISPTIELIVTEDNVMVESGSWSGFLRRVIPLRSVSSALYGYHKPWWALAIAAGLALLMFASATDSGGFMDGVVGLVMAAIVLAIGAVVYYLNRSLIVAVVEVGGIPSWLRFKRSVIEGQDVTQESAREVVAIIQELLDRKLNGTAVMPG